MGQNENKTDLKSKGGMVVVYLRVSTEEQVDNYSLTTQEDICSKEAHKKGLTVLKVFREEGRSAKTITGRPALIEMLEFCRKNKRSIDAVMVYRLDRISRQTSDYLAIRKKLAECDIQLLSASEPTGDSPAEKFIETMLAGFAQMDNDVRSERAKNGIRARLMNGLSNGYVPLGYVGKNGYATKDPETYEIIRNGWELIATGTKTLGDIANYLNEQGVSGGRVRNKQFKIRQQTVNRIFRNKFYMGKIVSAKYGLEIQGQHTPMITEEMFYKVQAILDGRNTSIHKPIAKRNRDNKEFPLRRIVKCDQCGNSFTGGWSKGKLNRYAYYFCPKCRGNICRIPKDDLQDETIKFLDSISLKPETIKLLNAYLRSNYYQRVSTLQKRHDEAEMELKKQYELRQKLIEKNLAGIYSDDVFKEQNKLIEEKIGLIQVAKSDDVLDRYNLEDITKFVEEKLGKLGETYDNSELPQIRMLLCSIYPSGMRWGENGYLNTGISPFYSGILEIQSGSKSIGAPRGI